MKKKLLKFFIIIGALGLLLTTLSATQVQGAIQANENTHYKGTNLTNEWMANFRNMETTGGALGLSETIHSSSLLPTSSSNNLDSHMVKSTEYGAAAILSASGYGNPKKLHESTIKTTTGNETGVFFNGKNAEYVAAGYQGQVFPNVDRRYYDWYEDRFGGDLKTDTPKVGDALGTKDDENPGCARWHSASDAGWATSRYPYFYRGLGGIFSFYYTNEGNNFVSRGVVVCGEGL